VWDWIKDYVQEKYPEVQRSYPCLREAVTKAWNSITNKQIRELIGTMHERCQAMIDTHGGYTKY
jgi:hypothetical protein